MKHWQIGQLSKDTNISIRTLRHYDRLGLLIPESRSDGGYRLYSEQDRQRLFDILFYRALGFSLHEIGKILTAKPEQRSQSLQQQLMALESHIERLTNMHSMLKLEIQKEETQMTDPTRTFDTLNGFDPDQYEDEVVKKWGETNSYKHSANRTSRYTQEDWARYKTESEQLNAELTALYNAGTTPSAPETLIVVEALRLQIDQWFYPCSPKMHASLGEMYQNDDRFKAFYEKRSEGLAQFIGDATAANLKTSLDDD